MSFVAFDTRAFTGLDEPFPPQHHAQDGHRNTSTRITERQVTTGYLAVVHGQRVPLLPG